MNIPTFEEAQDITGLNELDYDANKPEEAVADAPDMIDPDIEDTTLLIDRYKKAEKTGKCPDCGSKGIETYGVGHSTPDDFDITGLRGHCKKCGWFLEVDF